MFDDCTGEVPPAAPWYQHGYHGGKWPQGNLTLPGTDPAWGMAYTVIAHHMLDWYGDLRAVEEQYAGLVLYMRYLRNIPGVDPVVISVPDWQSRNVFRLWNPVFGPVSTVRIVTSTARCSRMAGRTIRSCLPHLWAFGQLDSSDFCVAWVMGPARRQGL